MTVIVCILCFPVEESVKNNESENKMIVVE